MNRLVFHIGMHKTGSTSIQESLSGYDNEVAYYPKFGGHLNHSAPLISLFSSRARVVLDNRRKVGKLDPIEPPDEEFRTAIKRAKGRTLILSSEGAYAFLSRDDLIGLCRFLEKTFDDYQFVAYVRPPIAYITSSFQQLVKSAQFARFDLSACYKSYRKAFKKFDDVFGRERVVLRKFDPASFPDGDVVADFASALHIPKPPTEQRVNGSLQRPTVSTLFLFNRLYAQNIDVLAHRAVSGAISRVCSDPAWPKFHFAGEGVAPIMHANKRDIDWIEERLGESMHETVAEDGVREEADLLNPDTRVLPYLRKIKERFTGIPPEGVTALSTLIDKCEHAA